MPDVTEADMGLREHEILTVDTGPLRKQYNLFFAVLGQFCYVGAEFAVANYYINFCKEAGYSSAMSSNLLAASQGIYAANRFIGAGLMTLLFFKPRFMVAAYLGLCVIFSLAPVLTTDKVNVAVLTLVLCFESFSPSVFRGLGRHTKRSGSFLVAAISGGAIFPPMTGAVATRYGCFYHAMAIPVAGFVLSLAFPIYVNVFNKESLDARGETDLNVGAAH